MWRRLRGRWKQAIVERQLRDRQRVFCIGFNKTGTTSLGRALREMGYRVGNQSRGEALIRAWAVRDFRPIIAYCRTAEAFQDIPFSLPFTFQAMDMAFPNSKFILSVRDSAEQWYNSLIRFHAVKFGGGSLPTRAQLEKATYRWPGWAWEVNRARWATPADDPYHKATLIGSYERHIEVVQEYFRHRDNLLVVNVANPGDYLRLCEFLGKQPVYRQFPWENRTSDSRGGTTAPAAVQEE